MAASCGRLIVLDLFEGGREIKALAVGVGVAGQALLLDGVLAIIDDESVLLRQGLIFHDVELFVLAPRAVANLAGHTLGLELGGLFEQRRMALEALRAFWALLDGRC